MQQSFKADYCSKTKDLYITIYYLDINLYQNMAKTLQIMDNGMHSPTLNTVLMVEKSLKEAGQIVTLAELKRRLPKKVMHQTLIQLLDYLQMSGKILIGTKGILWVFAERNELNKLINLGTEI